MSWQLFVKGVAGNTTVLHDIAPDCSIDDLMGKIAAKHAISTNELRVIFGGRQLECGKGEVLSDYKIVNMSTLFIVLRLRGGSNPYLLTRHDKKLTLLPGYIQLTSEPCMISFDDDPETTRAKMPCGHAIAPDSMAEYARSVVAGGFYVFRCPHPKCGAEWDYFLVRHVAALSEEQLQEFESKLAENYAQKVMGVQPCPGCRSLCMRVNSKANCVKCPECSKNKQNHMFCWSCLHPWLDSDKEQNNCGNPNCDGGDPRVRFLRNCPKTKIYEVSCPSLRACPGCGVLINHIDGCKHMQCTGCKQSFCFVCLGVPDSKGKWNCGSYNAKCTPADIQTQIKC